MMNLFEGVRKMTDEIFFRNMKIIAFMHCCRIFVCDRCPDLEQTRRGIRIFFQQFTERLIWLPHRNSRQFQRICNLFLRDFTDCHQDQQFYHHISCASHIIRHKRWNCIRISPKYMLVTPHIIPQQIIF